MVEEEQNQFREGLKAKSIKELRRMMYNAKDHTMQELGYIITEYRIRIPYCEACGEKAPVFFSISNEEKREEVYCPTCAKLLYENMCDGQWRCIFDKEVLQ